jgi:hypothetical protein
MRWSMAPGETFGAWRLAILDRISDPAEALTKLAARRAERQAAKQSRTLPVLDLTSQVLSALGARERLTVAFGALGRVDVPAALAMLSERETPVDQSYAYKLVRELGLTSPDKTDVKTPRRRSAKTSTTTTRKEVAK